MKLEENSREREDKKNNTNYDSGHSSEENHFLKEER